MKPRATRHDSDGAEAGGDLDDGVDEDEAGDGPVGAAVVVEPRQRVGPRVAGRRVEDGREGLVEHVQPVRRPELRHRHHRRCSRGDGCVRDAGGARAMVRGGALEGTEGAGLRWCGALEGSGRGCAGGLFSDWHRNEPVRVFSRPLHCSTVRCRRARKAKHLCRGVGNR